ncbi:DUF5822 domain-containing protein [Haloarchaeobius iranensis]|uniref:Peptidoglycan-binding protein n=1 Tax=Haloarchaeobius iranensis TaxID=996166 RepID=A0A1G9VYQ7_9EURY|nr:hypothetical protein SAMN05192554_10766 [Haloarchaeobius iranensis]
MSDADAEADEPEPVSNPEEAVDAAVGEREEEGVDYAWVMRTTFVVTILVGAPLVTLLSVPVSLPTWNARAEFAIRVGAVVWFLTAVGVYLYASRKR